MPEKEQPPIELRLRAYAEQRRTEAGGPFTPPPLTRRTVRAEVDRKWGHAARHGERLRRWNVMWPRLGWALGLTAVLAIVSLAVLDLRPRSKSQSLAKDSLSDAADRPTAPESLAPKAEAPAIPFGGRATSTVELAAPPLTSRTSAAEVRPQEAVSPSSAGRASGLAAVPSASEMRRYGAPPISASAPQPTGPTTAAAALRPEPTRSIGASADAPTSATQVAPALVASPAPPPAARGGSAPTQPTTTPSSAATPVAKSAAALELATASPSRFSNPPPAIQNQQRFAQSRARLLRQNLNSPPSPEVLQEFAVQQVGNRLQFTDRDGSIYFADVTASPQGTPLVAVPAPVLTQNQPAGLRGQPGRSQPQPVPAPGRSQATGNALFFNAVGTNRTLQQRVTFDGSLVFTNSHMPPPSLEVVLTNDAAFGIWLDNSRVEGEAIVGDRTRVQIEALPERE